ncbi:MAG: GNAT family N-acetyltransferase [Verrucomicrobiota bacterium]
MADASFIVDGNTALAREADRLELDPARVNPGVRAVLGDAAKGMYFIAEHDGQPAGQLMITYEWSDWRNGFFWWIQSVYVLEPFRGRGIFRALFAHVNALARRRPEVCGLRLYVDGENARAQQVYARMGMRRTSNQFFETDFVMKH